MEKKVLIEKVDELMKVKFARPSDSEYSSPVFLVKKKEGGFRMVVNYKELNKENSNFGPFKRLISTS